MKHLTAAALVALLTACGVNPIQLKPPALTVEYRDRAYQIEQRDARLFVAPRQ